MVLLTFETEDGLRLGVKVNNKVLDVAAALYALNPVGPQAPASLEALISGGPNALEALADFIDRVLELGATREWLLDETDLQLGPCVAKPSKIICIGLNYRCHTREAGLKTPETPVLFAKFNNAVAASGEPIPLLANAVEYDYEVELAVVIGRRARDVDEAHALDYVFGYCNANDLSARDLQTRSSQWLLGKTLDKFMPLGPYLVTADEVGDPQALDLRCWVNGELRQNSNTVDMIFSVAQLISYISQHMTLEPGDLISTGTPEGVILGTKEKIWLKPGDEVTVEVDKLGQLRNMLHQA